MSDQPAIEQPSKSALKKAQKELEKKAQKEKFAAEQLAKQQKLASEQAYQPPKLTLETLKTATFGDLPLHQSNFSTSDSLPSSTLPTTPGPTSFRAFLQTSRGTQKTFFALLRVQSSTIQAVHFDSPALIKYAHSIPKESYVQLSGIAKIPENPILSASLQSLEIEISSIFCISRAKILPLQIEDAGRSESQIATGAFVKVGRDVLFDNRTIDLRTAANNAIFKIRASIQQAFSTYLIDKNFLQITTPKILPGASESGSSVFTVRYFDQTACLAQSPQLYKQMTICGGFQRVFEVGPVFRAESSHTHRHLCEFTGLDLEMEIFENYREILVFLDGLMKGIFEKVLRECASEIAVIRKQFDVLMPEELVWGDSAVIVDFREGVKMLNESGFQQGELDDLSTENERQLGKLVKEKFGTDFYILDKFPMNIRPFYTMPDAENDDYSNSYDMFIRGQEICSGAQRIHDADFLALQIEKKGIPGESLESYVNAFKYGCPPHGGAGLGLERIVMLMLGIQDCRQCCLFPRTPERLSP